MPFRPCGALPPPGPLGRTVPSMPRQRPTWALPSRLAPIRRGTARFPESVPAHAAQPPGFASVRISRTVRAERTRPAESAANGFASRSPCGANIPRENEGTSECLAESLAKPGPKYGETTAEDALAEALTLAAQAGQWGVVAQLAKELEARRLAASVSGSETVPTARPTK